MPNANKLRANANAKRKMMILGSNQVVDVTLIVDYLQKYYFSSSKITKHWSKYTNA